MSFGTRLLEFREYTGLSQVEFAEHVGVSQANITHWENNRSKPNATKMKLIESAFPSLNTEWLLTGHGDMIVPEGEKKEQELLKHYRKENKELEEKVKQLQERIQFLTDKLLKLNEEYTELLKSKNK